MRTFLRYLSISIVFVCGLVGTAAAQTYPSGTITIVVPFTAGGAVDAVARAYASELQEQFGTPVVVNNKPGAGGAIGAQYVASTAPDGYTLLLASVGPMTINPNIQAKLPFNVERDYEAVVLLAKTPAILVVHPDNPVNTIQQFNAWVGRKSKQLNYGSAGVGNITHVVAEYYMNIAKLQASHIPYKGSTQAVTDMLGGRLDFMFDVVPTAQPFVQSGKFKALAVSTMTRSPVLPEVPTLNELGYKGFDVSSWFGIFAPAGTPEDIIRKLNAAANSGLSQGAGLAKLQSLGTTFVGGTPGEFKAFVASETARWKKVVDDAGIKAN